MVQCIYHHRMHLYVFPKSYDRKYLNSKGRCKLFVNTFLTEARDDLHRAKILPSLSNMAHLLANIFWVEAWSQFEWFSPQSQTIPLTRVASARGKTNPHCLAPVGPKLAALGNPLSVKTTSIPSRQYCSETRYYRGFFAHIIGETTCSQQRASHCLDKPTKLYFICEWKSTCDSFVFASSHED